MLQTGLSLKLTYMELAALNSITGNDAAVLMVSKNNMNRLCGLVILKLHKRVNRRIDFRFDGEKSLRFNLEECLALRQFINYLAPSGYEYEKIVRLKIFTAIDQKIL